MRRLVEATTETASFYAFGGASRREGSHGGFFRRALQAQNQPAIYPNGFLPNIITKMNLPVMGPDGQPMSYSLDHKEGGKRLREEQTLVEAAVSDGHHLIVYPEIVAGRP